jgi:hypothetical protein
MVAAALAAGGRGFCRRARRGRWHGKADAEYALCRVAYTHGQGHLNLSKELYPLWVIGKKIELALLGEATEIDKVVVDCLYEPLVHVIRNSADHGPELPDERVAAGKPATGTITLSAQQVGGEVALDCACLAEM